MTQADKPPTDVEVAMGHLFEQFSVLAAVGWQGGALAGEQGTYRLTVPFTGRVMQGITVVSNMPILPYAANPTRLVQDAVFKWLLVLTGVMQHSGDPQLALLHQAYEWELKMAQRREETHQLKTFRDYLATMAQELGEGIGDTKTVLREIRELAVQAPTPSLRIKCCRAVADNHLAMAAAKSLPEEERETWMTWLEPYMDLG